MKKRLIVTLAGLLAVGAMASAANLSLTHEAKLNNHHQGSEVTNDKDQVEYTLAKGSAKINDDWSFIFDLDRDYYDVDGGDNYQGWDGEFGFKRKLADYDMFGKTWSNDIRFEMDYDAYDSVKNGTGTDSVSEKYYIKYVNSTSLTERTDFGWYTELGYQTSDKDEYTSGVKTTNGHSSDLRAQLDFSLDTTWNEYWNSYTEVYLWYKENADRLDVDVEHYTNFAYPLFEGDKTSLTFNTEFGIESYDHTWKKGRDADSTEFYVQPGLLAKYKHDDALSFHAYAGYKVYDDNTSIHDTSSTGHTADNEFEAVVGFKAVM
ncbi:hypothetical protein [uncultured Ilyobacter sp.]|uniref:hypothetical protein n=1 Tax=uncultured Ilyobacter sp. TaxID=544433 RepID=UPI0029F46BAC|nr:hypothetical protein [uncultured Ilyobacter sp.]